MEADHTPQKETKFIKPPLKQGGLVPEQKSQQKQPEKPSALLPQEQQVLDPLFVNFLLSTLETGSGYDKREAEQFLMKHYARIAQNKNFPADRLRQIDRRLLVEGTSDQQAMVRRNLHEQLVQSKTENNPLKAARALGDVVKLLNIQEGLFTQEEQEALFHEMQSLVSEYYLAPYGLDPKALFTVWRESARQEEVGYAILKNIDTIEELEKKRPGICKALSEGMFGIRDFARYPLEMLIAQYDNRDNQNMRYGVIIFPRHDWNGAFYDDVDPFREMYEDQQAINEALQAEGKEPCGVRIFEVASKIGIGRALLRADRAYGKQHKIEFAFIGGHGANDSIQFGGDETGIRGHTLSQTELAGKGAQRVIPQFFEPNSTVVLVSCSTGQLGGIGQEISKMGATVIAPEVPTKMKTIEVNRAANDRLQFNVQFWEPGSERTYTAGVLHR